MVYQNSFYLTGSINQPTVEEAFRFVGTRLQPAVKRVPDGEPGERANWVLTQTPHFLENPTLDVVDKDGRALASWVHDDVELTFHLCYGDSKFGASPFMGDPPDDEAAARGGRHIYPRDASTIVAVSNGLSRHVPRRIDAIQAATVTAWNRLAHWQPLANLAIEPDTEFYLGLLHAEDGAAGARYRAALAAKFLPEFGISTECGLGRHSAEQLDQVVSAVDELFEARQTALA